MKCETLPASTHCLRCIRRNLQCVFSRVSWAPSAQNALSERYELSLSINFLQCVNCEANPRFRQKIDSMQQQIQQLQQTLNTVVQFTTNSTPVQRAIANVEHVSSPYSTLSPIGGAIVGPLTVGSNVSDSMVSARSGENTRMDMTRENSPEPSSSVDRDVLVTEPMGSLYEVTRLRNIRSNQSRTFRSDTVDESEPDDLISRGVSLVLSREAVSRC
jgi:hypothetical protein